MARKAVGTTQPSVSVGLLECGSSPGSGTSVVEMDCLIPSRSASHPDALSSRARIERRTGRPARAGSRIRFTAIHRSRAPPSRARPRGGSRLYTRGYRLLYPFRYRAGRRDTARGRALQDVPLDPDGGQLLIRLAPGPARLLRRLRTRLPERILRRSAPRSRTTTSRSSGASATGASAPAPPS